MMSSYLQFCADFSVPVLNPTVPTVIAYLEYLSIKLKSPKSVANYWGSVKLLHTIMKVQFPAAEDFQTVMMLKAIPITKRHVSQQKAPLSRKQLQQICDILDGQGTQGLVIKTAILLGFNAFLRASNICPESFKSFDPTRHFCRKDITVTGTGLQVHLKWAKNMQSSLQPHTISVPPSQPSSSDPVANFIKMCRLVPASPHSPLFMLDTVTPLTLPKFRNMFTFLLGQIGVHTTNFSVHSLCRGGATDSYLNGADPIDIQRHGAWSSLAFWDYIAPHVHQNSSVFTALAHNPVTSIS